MWRTKRAKSITSAVVLLLAVSGSAVGASASADQAKKAKRADLVVKSVNGSVTARTAQVSATVTNKPGKKKGKKSKASTVAFVLSADAAVGAGDTTLGQLAAPKLKPKKSATVAGSFAIPATTPAGSYYVVACADAGAVVKEKKEQNNCSASAAKVTVPTAPAATVTVTYSSGLPPFGTVSATASHGTCAADPLGGGVCTVSAGVGTVVLSANVAFPLAFLAYTDGGSGPCDGAKVGPTVTFTAPTVNKSCLATFGPVTPRSDAPI
jgi:hypothetical protein